MKSKKQLEVALSKLSQIEQPKITLEQYSTPSNIAAEILWIAYMNNDINSKVIADLGCGNGIFGIGCLLLNAKKVFFLDSDSSSLSITKKNLSSLNLKNSVIINKEVTNFNKETNTIIQNPPFGVQNEHADKPFLEKAMDSADKIYSLHKIESKNFISALAKEKNFKLLNIMPFKLPLKKTQKYHTKEKYNVKIGCFILSKIN